jgi:hypothetical protein
MQRNDRHELLRLWEFPCAPTNYVFDSSEVKVRQSTVTLRRKGNY